MKELVILALAGIGGIFLYKKMSGSSGDAVIAGQAIAQKNSAQPSNTYPFMPASNSIARQDNQAQPWYGGSQAFNGKSQNIFGINVGDLSASASIIDSTKSIWADLDIGSWFSGSSDEYSLDDYAMNDYADFSYDWSSLDSDTASGLGQYDFSAVA